MDKLTDILKSVTGTKRIFIIMRVAGLDTDISMQLTGVSRGTYNSWFKNDEFSTIYKQVPELIAVHRDEAVQLLRRKNQLEAVLLEGKIVSKIKEELETGDYRLTKTHLAREVYSKLMSDLDKNPEGIKQLTWMQRIQTFQINPKEEGELIDGQFEEISEQSPEHQTSQLAQASEQTSSKTEETT